MIRLEGNNLEEIDCVVGCKGPRSPGRDKQAKDFGGVEKRKFMDCVGVVANMQRGPAEALEGVGLRTRARASLSNSLHHGEGIVSV